MIKIDYLLRRDHGNRILEFRPDKVLSDLPLLSYIEAKNAFGKSTLMNIIALAFFGQNLSSEELNPKLKDNLLSLLDSVDQIQFKIEVKNEKLGVHFVSEKKDLDSKQIVLRRIIDGKAIPISEDVFKREYKLIYEIPNNPLDRFQDLLNTLKDHQKDFSTDIAQLRDRIRILINEIKDSRDPEQISSLRSKLVEDEKSSEDFKQKVNDQKNKIKRMQEYFYARFITFYRSSEKELQTRYTYLKNQINTEKRNQSKKYKDYKELTYQLGERINDLESLKDSIDLVLHRLIDKEIKDKYSLWKRADIREEIYRPEIYSSRHDAQLISKYFSNKILDERRRRSQDLEKQKLYKSLIAILRDYSDDIHIPGVNLSISDLISNLEDQVNELHTITSHIDNIDRCAQSLERYYKYVIEGIEIAEKIKQNNDFGEKEIEDFSSMQELEELERRIKVYKEKIASLQKSASSNSFDPDDLEKRCVIIEKDAEFILYNTYNEKQIEEKIHDMRVKLEDYQSSFTRYERRLEDEREELERLENKKPHKYQSKFSVLHDLLNNIQGLEVLFHSFDSWLSNIKNKKGLSIKNSEDELKYREMVGQYLAKKVGKLKHISQTYSVKMIDVVAEKIYTEEGDTIRFHLLSGGQGRAAYLEGLLGMSENKKIIALFDEVATMDDSSLEPILGKLRDLYNENKLLLAVIAQKRNEGVLVKDIYVPSVK